MRRFLQAATFVTLVLATRVSSADPIEVGDLLRFQTSTGTLGGGVFLIDNTANGVGFDFTTFCLQITQHVSYSEVFRVGGITDFADDLGGNDPISTATQWIFSSFRAGSLGAYSPDAIQAAIWTLEDEWTTEIGNSAALISLAQSQVAGGWVNDGVGVINLFYTDGRRAQDQLTQTLPQAVPEPGTLALFGIGVVVLAARKRLSDGNRSTGAQMTTRDARRT